MKTFAFFIKKQGRIHAERKWGCLTYVIQPRKSGSADEIRRFDLAETLLINVLLVKTAGVCSKMAAPDRHFRGAVA